MSETMLNLMLASAGRHVPLLREFRRAMNDLGISGQIIAADSDPHFAAAQVADAAVITPPADSPDYADALLTAVTQHNVGFVIPLSDAALPALAAAKESLAARGCKTLISSADAIATCQDTARFHDVMTKTGLPTCRRVCLKTFRRDPFFPCFARPTAGKDVANIADENALSDYLATYGEAVIVQDFAGGREYEVDAYQTQADALCVIAPRQRLVIRRGETEDAVTLRDKELADATRRAIDAIPHLAGPLCCRCVRPDNDPPRILQLLPRLTFAATLSIAAGADLPRLCLQDALGQSLDTPTDLRTNLMMASYRADTFCETADAATCHARKPTFK